MENLDLKESSMLNEFKLPSEHQIGDNVLVWHSEGNKRLEGRVIAVHFEDNGLASYDVKLHGNYGLSIKDIPRALVYKSLGHYSSPLTPDIDQKQWKKVMKPNI